MWPQAATDEDVRSIFRSGAPLAELWTPIPARLFEYDGEPVADFASIGGAVPFAISETTLTFLSPLISADSEALELVVDFGRYFLLNVFALDSLDADWSSIRRFSSGRVRRVEAYAFKEVAIRGHHIFRLPQEAMGRTFVDEVFKRDYDDHGFRGLDFFETGEEDRSPDLSAGATT